MASLMFKDLNKRLLGLSCSSAASTSVVGRHSPHLQDPDRRPSSKQKKNRRMQQQQLVSPASSSRFLLNSSRIMQPLDAVAAGERKEEEEEEEEEEEAPGMNGTTRSWSTRRRNSKEQVVVLRVSLHCKGCAGKVKKHISRMEGVTSMDIDIATKKVTVVGDVTPLAVLTTVSKVKPAQFWPSPSSSSLISSPLPPRASASF
ncbi:hypothetical protein ABZP36_026019 [Zizania latifolia]